MEGLKEVGKLFGVESGIKIPIFSKVKSVNCILSAQTQRNPLHLLAAMRGNAERITNGVRLQRLRPKIEERKVLTASVPDSVE